MNPEWVRNLRDQCNSAGIAFHFKQWGHWAPEELLTEQQKKVIVIDGNRLAAVGKKHAGRLLDGRTWDEVPSLQIVPGSHGIPLRRCLLQSLGNASAYRG